jgi:O-antigen/teichoic acid export membrane protein
MIWGTAGLMIGKLGSAAAAVCLGWIFGTGDYGAASAALSAAMIGDVLTDGGLRRVLITRGAEFATLARTAFAVALAFNLLGCTLMFAAAALYRTEHPDAVGQLVVFGIALVLSTFGTIQRCKLTIDLRFAQSTFLATASSLLRNVLTVAFAWYGLGPLAFALPLIFVNVWEAAYVRRTVGRLPPAPLKGSVARELIAQGRWVIVAAIGGSLIARGDFLVATWMFTRDQSGAYFFAFLPLAIFAPFSAGAVAMVQPVMARLRDDPARQAMAFTRVVRSMMFIGAPLSMATAIVAPLLIHVAWQGRWDGVTPAVQVLAAAECARQLLSMSLATLDARGEYRRSAMMILIDGATTVAAALVGCATGSVLWLATIIAVQRTLASLAEVVYVQKRGGGGGRAILVEVLPPLMIASAIGAVAILAAHALTTDASAQRWALALLALPALGIYALACRLIVPRRLGEVVELVRQRVRR